MSSSKSKGRYNATRCYRSWFLQIGLILLVICVICWGGFNERQTQQRLVPQTLPGPPSPYLPQMCSATWSLKSMCFGLCQFWQRPHRNVHNSARSSMPCFVWSFQEAQFSDTWSHQVRDTTRLPCLVGGSQWEISVPTLATRRPNRHTSYDPLPTEIFLPRTRCKKIKAEESSLWPLNTIPELLSGTSPGSLPNPNFLNSKSQIQTFR